MENVRLPITPPELRDAYSYVRCLGEGAQGRTYLARRLSVGDFVAIKELRLSESEDFKGFELFLRESEVLSSVDDPGVPKFIERRISVNKTGPCFIVQEYCEFGSVQKVLDLHEKSRQAFSIEVMGDILVGVAQILDRLETRYVPPIIHRDIKPSNILFARLHGDIQCRLIDFGAVANPQRRSRSSTVAGTCGYMAPEQLCGECSPASDIYALGMTAVQMLTGIPPWKMPVHGLQVRYESILKEMRPDVQEDVFSLLRAMTSSSLEERIPDASSLLQHPFCQNVISRQAGKVVKSSQASSGARLRRIQTRVLPVIFEIMIVIGGIECLIAMLSGKFLFIIPCVVCFCVFFEICYPRTALRPKRRGYFWGDDVARTGNYVYSATTHGRVESVERVAVRGGGNIIKRSDLSPVLGDNNIEYIYEVDGEWLCGAEMRYGHVEVFPVCGEEIGVRYDPRCPWASRIDMS